MQPHGRLGLGTVQFGTDYGVSNRRGRTPPSEVRQILDLARRADIHWIDTAPAYGRSETVLGTTLLSERDFRIVTKTWPCGGMPSRTAVTEVLNRFTASLQRLRRPTVDALLVHHAADLLASDGERLWEALELQQANGRIGRIGVSVYTPAELEILIDRFPIQMVQLPLNVFDQSFIREGHLTELARRGIAVHSRSCFLQGLLLMAPTELPTYFAPLRPHLARFHGTLAAHGLSPAAGALSFALCQPTIEAVIIGVNTADQLRELLISDPVDPAIDWISFALEDDRWLNPSNWRLE